MTADRDLAADKRSRDFKMVTFWSVCGGRDHLVAMSCEIAYRNCVIYIAKPPSSLTGVRAEPSALHLLSSQTNRA